MSHYTIKLSLACSIYWLCRYLDFAFGVSLFGHMLVRTSRRRSSKNSVDDFIIITAYGVAVGNPSPFSFVFTCSNENVNGGGRLKTTMFWIWFKSRANVYVVVSLVAGERFLYERALPWRREKLCIQTRRIRGQGINERWTVADSPRAVGESPSVMYILEDEIIRLGSSFLSNNLFNLNDGRRVSPRKGATRKNLSKFPVADGEAALFEFPEERAESLKKTLMGIRAGRKTHG